MFKKNNSNDISITIKRIYKNKKLANEEKVSLIIKTFSYYFQNKMHIEVEKCTYKNYFEKIMIDGEIKNEVMFKKYYNLELENALFLHTIALNKYFLKLEDNVDLNKLKDKEKNIFKNVISFSQKCNFHDSFNYSAFYYNEGVRRIILENLKMIENDFKSLRSENIFTF